MKYCPQLRQSPNAVCRPFPELHAVSQLHIIKTILHTKGNSATPTLAPAVFSLRFSIPFPCCGHNVLILHLDSEGVWPEIARPSQWPPVPALQGTRLCSCWPRQALASSPAADRATITYFFPFGYSLGKLPRLHVTGSKTADDSMALGSRLMAARPPWRGPAEHVALPHRT